MIFSCYIINFIMKNKIIILTLILVFFPSKVLAAEKNFSITCSLFPVYDFAKQVAGNEADVNLLLKPGVEPHEFEPSPLDIKILNDSDVFIFTGEHMEHWAKEISNSLHDVQIIDASEKIKILEGDPHIWLDLNKAQAMVMNISEGLSRARPEKSEIFRRNAEDFCKKLAELDKKFAALKKDFDDKTLVFAGEFAFNYFIKRYDFNFISAYDGENEPSIKRMAEVLKFIKENDVKYILAGSLEISAITHSIAEQTGTEILFFDAAESVPQNSRTFLEIMTANYESLLLINN